MCAKGLIKGEGPNRTKKLVLSSRVRQEATNQENKRPDEVCSGGVSNICLVVYVVIVKRSLLRDPYIIPKSTGFHVRKVSKQEILSGNPLPPPASEIKGKNQYYPSLFDT